MANSSSHLQDIELAARRLQLQWDATLDVWNDGVQHDFEERFYTQIQQEHRRLTKSASVLVDVLQKAQQTIR